MTYLATPGQDSTDVKLFIGTPGMPSKSLFQGKNSLAMLKRMVSMATLNDILLNLAVPAKTTISQLLFSLDYLSWYQIKATRYYMFLTWPDMQIFLFKYS